MKDAPAVANALRTQHNITATPKATIEWNLNRYFDLRVFNDVPSEVDENDEDLFPIDSIVQPWRPRKGINKARVGMAYATAAYTDWPMARFYAPSEKDKYKYWMSPYASDANGMLSNCVPTVIYDEPAEINKIRVTVEDTWASPVDYQIQYTTNGGGSWTNTAQGTVNNDGTIEVYWNGTSWSGTAPASLSSTIRINGVRFVCTRLGAGRLADGSVTKYRSSDGEVATTGNNSYLSLIEIAPYLVRDVSDLVVSVDDTFDSGSPDIVSPVGRLTSNTGTVVLWNEGNIFSTENVDSPYHKLIEQNAEVNLSYVFDIGGTEVEVKQFKMYSDTWEEDEGQVSVSVTDASKHLQEIKPLAAKYEGMRLSDIMYRLCDSIGWNYYNIDHTLHTKDLVIPVFWTDGEQTLWEILDELATASQSTVYFDENGYMNVKTREDAFSPDAAPVWTLRGQQSGDDLANIESFSRGATIGSNMVKVTYQTTRWADIKNGFAENSPVWEGEDPTVLRSSPLLKTLPVGVLDADGRERLQMTPRDASTWPHQGMMLIEGEVIEYDAKMFVYQEGGQTKRAWVTTQAEHDDYNTRVEYVHRKRNYYDGQFRIKERGLWNTAVKPHYVDANGWNVTRFLRGGAKSGGGFTHDRRESVVHLRTAGVLKHANEWLTVTRGGPGDSPWRYIGTKLIFNKSNAKNQAAGIVFNMGSGKDGYYVELCPTSQIKGKNRAVRNELVFYVIKDGKKSRYWPVKGAAAPVVTGLWGELDIWYSMGGQRIIVFYRGKKYLDFNVPSAWQLTASGKFGMFARGSTNASFDYVYASSRFADPEPTSDYSSLHRIEGVSIGRTFAEEWKHRNTRRERNRRKKTKKSIYDKNQRFMDEFGPYCHEYREFEVKFDPAPVQHSFLYSTNDWAAYLIDYYGDSFHGYFTMVSTERYNAILAGNDTLVNPGGEGINQQIIVFGRALVVEDGEEIVSKNEQQIRARGEVVTELNSPWIQSKEAAQEVADWIKNHWSRGVDEVSAVVFGNPLLQVGDVVSIDYVEKDMEPATHHYFVVSVATSFEQGISTSLVLRRRN